MNDIRKALENGEQDAAIDAAYAIAVEQDKARWPAEAFASGYNAALTAAHEQIAELQKQIEAKDKAFDRSSHLINQMAEYVGQMALDADTLSSLNQHWLYAEQADRAAMGGGE